MCGKKDFGRLAAIGPGLREDRAPKAQAIVTVELQLAVTAAGSMS
jgi:hypothetical protein